MKLSIYSSKNVTVDVSFDGGVTKLTYNLVGGTPTIVTTGKNSTAGIICNSPDDIRVYTTDDNYITVTYDNTVTYFLGKETTDTIYCHLADLATTLANLEDNTVDTAYKLKILDIDGNVANFDTINTAITTAAKYIDLSPTRFYHTDISEAQSTSYSNLSTVEESDGTLRFTNPFLFPLSFAGNTYITGITIPKEDNYIKGSFIDCTNLQNVYFEDNTNKAWVASGYIKNALNKAIPITTTNGTYVSELANLDLSGYSFYDENMTSLSMTDSAIIAELLRTGATSSKKALVLSSCWTKHQG